MIPGRIILCVLFFVFFPVVDMVAQLREPCPVAKPGHVVIYGDVPNRLEIPHAELLSMPRTSLRATSHDGGPASYEGVTLRELLTRAGVPVELRSGDLVRYVVAEAADGYRTVFTLAELDPAFREQLPILADRENGGAIPAEYGPVQIIVPGEIRHARWVRQVTCLRLARDSL